MSEPILVCHRAADAPRVTRETRYDRKCSRCGERVAMARSTQTYLKAHPQTTILCCRCHPPHPGDRVTLAAGDEASARAEAAATIPNTWRQRN